MKIRTLFYLLILIIASAGGCASHTRDDAAGLGVIHEDPSAVGSTGGIGIDSRDIVTMTDRMVADMLQNPLLSGRKPAPRIVIDAEYFANRSSSRLDKNMITDRLRTELNRAANGRILFIARHYDDMIDQERQAKRQGELSAGSMGMAQAKAGADFRLGGRISSRDSLSNTSGRTSRYHQILFELVDLEVGAIVWSNMYEVKKTARDDVVYR